MIARGLGDGEGRPGDRGNARTSGRVDPGSGQAVADRDSGRVNLGSGRGDPGSGQAVADQDKGRAVVDRGSGRAVADRGNGRAVVDRGSGRADPGNAMAGRDSGRGGRGRELPRGLPGKRGPRASNNPGAHRHREKTDAERASIAPAGIGGVRGAALALHDPREALAQ